MAKPPIASKNLEGLNELMGLEELAYKKYSVYAESIKNAELKNLCSKHAQNHKARFETLVDYLNQHE